MSVNAIDPESRTTDPIVRWTPDDDGVKELARHDVLNSTEAVLTVHTDTGDSLEIMVLESGLVPGTVTGDHYLVGRVLDSKHPDIVPGWYILTIRRDDYASGTASSVRLSISG